MFSYSSSWSSYKYKYMYMCMYVREKWSGWSPDLNRFRNFFFFKKKGKKKRKEKTVESFFSFLFYSILRALYSNSP